MAAPGELSQHLKHQFRPAGRVTFVSRDKSNQNRLPHDPAQRCAPGPLPPVLLHRHAPKRHPWRIGTFSASCLEACCATPALGLLKGAIECHRILNANARSTVPVSRVSGIGVEGVERHGCRESCDGPRMALRSVPLERRWSERTLSAKRSGPDVGCVSSWLLLLAA